MGALDRLQNYSAKYGLNEKEGVFDVSTPSGAFLSRVHKEGYKMYDWLYKAENGAEISEDAYLKLPESEKALYKREVVYTELHNALTCEGNQIINAVAGSGKCELNGTGVLTEGGFVPIETLQVGDMVYAEDGKLYPVLGVYPRGKKRAYEVIFSDGSKIICGDDHLWTVREPEKSDWVTLSTKELVGTDGYEIPMQSPVGFSNEYRHTDLTADTSFIQPYYLYGGVDSRLEILKSAVDLWGSYHKDCYTLLLNTKQLADDLTFIAESLGLVASSYEEPDTGKCTLDIKLSKAFGKLHTKKSIEDVWVKPDFYGKRCMVSVKELSYEADMTCIEVGSPSHLYLTEHFIPTHNTTALVFKIMYDIVTGEAVVLKSINGGTPIRVVDKMWVCTFLKTGAEELEERLTNWQRKLGYSQTSNQISFSTMDAEFKRCLNAMGVATNIGTASQLNSLLRKAVDSCGIKRNGYNLTKEDYQIIEGIVVYYRGRLDDKKYSHPSCRDYDLTPTVLDLLVKQYAALRQREGVMDFEEIMELLYKYLYITPNQSVQDFVANRYNYIYVDEFQDTSQMAYAILKFYARGKLWVNRSGDVSDSILYTGQETKGKFTVVGDASQSIYSFRGSDSRIISEYADTDFRPSISNLSVNWRCPSNILNPVVPSIHKNKDSAGQVIKASKTGGEFFAYKFTSYKTMIDHLKSDITKDMEDGLDVAILCRTNFDGLIPSFILEAEGRFNFSVSGENMTLNSPLARKLIGVVSLFTERATPAVKNVLEMFAGRGSQWEVKQLMDTLKTNNCSIWQIPVSDIKYSCPSLESFVSSVRNIFIDSSNKRDKSKELEALRVVYFMLKSYVFDKDNAYCKNARACIETLVYVLDNGSFNTVYDFVEEIELLNDKLNARIKKKRADIRIATVHEFKGKECDSVYVWNDSVDVFPSSKCDIDVEEQLEEERRVHYIACTRAKKREHIYSLQDSIGVFAKEMDCTFENPVVPTAKLEKR